MPLERMGSFGASLIRRHKARMIPKLTATRPSLSAGSGVVEAVPGLMEAQLIRIELDPVSTCVLAVTLGDQTEQDSVVHGLKRADRDAAELAPWKRVERSASHSSSPGAMVTPSCSSRTVLPVRGNRHDRHLGSTY